MSIMRRIFLFLVLLIVACSACKVSSEDVIIVELKDTEELLVFYEEGTKNILDNFQIQYPEYDLKVKKFYGEEESLKDLILYNGEPDIILLNYKLNSDYDRMLEEKYGYDLSDFVKEDVNIENDQYFPGTFSVGKNNDELVALPLGIGLQMIIMREEVWLDTEFAALDNNYTAQDLLEAIEVELDRKWETGVVFNPEQVGISYQMLQTLGAIEKNGGEVTINEEIYAQLYEIWYKGKQYLEDLDATGYNGQFEMTFVRPLAGAPQISLASSTSYNKFVYDQDIHVLYFPCISDTSGYGASVQTAGLVGKNSNSKQQAYEFLKLLMDTPIETYILNDDLFETTFCPVNKENAQIFLEKFEEVAKSQGGIPFGSWGEEQEIIELTKVSEIEREKLYQVIDNIQYLYRKTDTGEKVDEIIRRYQDMNSKSYKESYLEVLNMLNERVED